MSRTIRKDLYSLDPRRIVTEGFYVRETDVDDADFAAFLEAVRQRGEIDQPISVRTRVVSPQEKHYILVWGMRRLRAALALGLPHVPVRDFGEIDETAAIRLQLQENLNRKEMTPVETALAFWELSQRGVSGADIARDNARTKGYVSALLNTGQAIAALTPAERRALSAPGRFRVRDAQALMAVKGTEARADALRALLHAPLAAADDDAPETLGHETGVVTAAAPDATALDAAAPDAADSPTPPLGRARRSDEDGPFHVRPLRGGRGRVVRIRWHDQDLRERPREFIERFAGFLQQEVDHLHARLAALETALPPSATQAADFHAAKERALRLASWLREEGSRGG
jgi:ParB family chromosome partitioning protein